MREIEVKAKVSDATVVSEKLKSIGAKLVKTVDQHDYIYYEQGRQLDDLGKNPIVIRIRIQNDSAILTLKQAISNDLDCIEKEMIIGDRSCMHDIIEMMGHKLRLEIIKHRESWRYKDVEICLDTVDDLGSFIEVERMVDEGDIENIQDQLFGFLKDLGIDESDRVFEGYDVMMIKRKCLK